MAFRFSEVEARFVRPVPRSMDDLAGLQAEALIAHLLTQPETARFDCKRFSGKMVGKAPKTLCALANTDPGFAPGGRRQSGARGPTAGPWRRRLSPRTSRDPWLSPTFLCWRRTSVSSLGLAV